jgi:hypothetical protein
MRPPQEAAPGAKGGASQQQQQQQQQEVVDLVNEVDPLSPGEAAALFSVQQAMAQETGMCCEF